MSCGQLTITEQNNALVVDGDGCGLTIQQTKNRLEIDATRRGLQGAKGESANELIAPAGEAIMSHHAIALVGGLAYHYDASNLEHLFAFVGFSTSSASVSANVTIKSDFIELPSWGLMPNSHYRAGINGAILEGAEPLTTQKFSKILGYAVTATRLKIITDNNPIKLT